MVISILIETITFEKINFPVKITQSCNGLFLCSSCPYDSKKCIYYIFNPFTRKYSVLSESILRKGGFTYAGNVSLIYDPLRSPYYKVICLWDVKTSIFKKKIEIYSSETKSWKDCGDEFTFAESIGTMSGVFWNGMLNWLSYDESLVYFDIDREIIGSVPRPHQDLDYLKYISDYIYSSFGEYGGHLFCIEVSVKNRARFDVLEMDTCYTGWSVKYKVDLEQLFSYPSMTYRRGYNLISFEEDVEDSPKLILLIHHSEVVISFDLVNTSFEELCYVAPQHYAEEGIPCQGEFRFHKYIESLACV